MRFEVSKNGQRICTSGLENTRGLGFSLHFERFDGRPKLYMSLEGFGSFRWPMPSVAKGDEITLRILAPGEFDAPEHIKERPLKSMEDSEFGTLTYNGEKWQAWSRVPCDPIQSAWIHIHAGELGPTQEQRDLFRQFAAEHARLWPEIRAKLLECYVDVRSVEDMLKRLDSSVWLKLLDDSPSLHVIYHLSDGADHQNCLVNIHNWQIVSAELMDDRPSNSDTKPKSVFNRSIRFEIIKNGQPSCTCGIDGDGILVFSISRINRPGHTETLRQASGSSRIDNDPARLQRSSWAIPEVSEGDVFAIRILSEGPVDEPTQQEFTSCELMDDSQFGVWYTDLSGSWRTEVPLASAPFEQAELHFKAPEEPPTEAQRQLFRDLTEVHGRLWPEISEQIVRAHPEIATTEELQSRVNPKVKVVIYDDCYTIEVFYSVRSNSGISEFMAIIRDSQFTKLRVI